MLSVVPRSISRLISEAVSGGENPHIDGGRFILDEHQGWQALGSRIVARLRVEGAAVLTAVQDASRRCAVPFGPP
jgi:hypothetical protein